MSGYSLDRRWSDRFIPEIQRIVGPFLLRPSSFNVDTQQAADLVLLKARGMDIAARVRRSGYADRYPFEFTIRSGRDTGAKTELAKLMEGFGDWLFYGHSCDSEKVISRWFLIDLHVWRESLLRHGYKSGWGKLARAKSNSDGTHFIAFDVRDFQPHLLIGSSHLVGPRAAA